MIKSANAAGFPHCQPLSVLCLNTCCLSRGDCDQNVPPYITEPFIYSIQTHCCCYENEAIQGQPLPWPPVNTNVDCTNPCSGWLPALCKKYYVDASWPINVKIFSNHCYERDPETGALHCGSSVVVKTRVYYCHCEWGPAPPHQDCNFSEPMVVQSVCAYSCLSCGPPPDPRCNPNP